MTTRALRMALTALLALSTLASSAEAQRRRRPAPRPRATPAPVAPVVEAPPPAPVAPAPEPPPAPAPPAPPPAEAPAADPPAVSRPVALDLTVGGRAFRRHLSYTDDLFGVLRAYDLNLGPAAYAAVEWYPGAHFSNGPLAHLGLVASGEYAFALRSRDPATDASYDTRAWSASLGVRARLPLGASEVGLTGAYLLQQYAVEGTRHGNDPGVPTVTYQSLRAGLSARIALTGWFALTAGAGYLFVLSAGEMSSEYFPRAQMGAVDAALGAALAVASEIEVRLGLDARRYFYSFHPEPGDPWIAGGALDHYFGATLGVALRR